MDIVLGNVTLTQAYYCRITQMLEMLVFLFCRGIGGHQEFLFWLSTPCKLTMHVQCHLQRVLDQKSCSSTLYNINSQLKNSWQRQFWGRQWSLLQYHNVCSWLERMEMGCWVAMTTSWEGNGIARGCNFLSNPLGFLKHWHNEWVSLGQTFELPLLAGLGLVFHFSDSNLISEVGT